MKKGIAFSLLFAIAASLLLETCKKVENFPVIPAIIFKEFKKYGSDSATCAITFTDGDGDIGLDTYDTVPPYNPASHYYSDFYMVYYYQDSTGNWKLWDKIPSTPQMDTLQYGFRIPNLTQNGLKKALEGEIRVHLNAPYSVPIHHFFKFKITLIDRALHISNEVDTGPLTYP